MVYKPVGRILAVLVFATSLVACEPPVAQTGEAVVDKEATLGETTNLTANPSFETNLSGWIGWQSTLSRVPGAEDAYVAKVSRTTGISYSIDDEPASVPSTTAGATYQATALVAAASSSAVGKRAEIVIRERNPSGADVKLTFSTPVYLAFGYQRLTVSAMAQSGGNVIDVFVYQGEATSGDAFFVDSIRLTASTGTGGGVCNTTGTRDPGLWPFDMFSPWNMPLGANATFASTSDAATAAVLNQDARVNANNGYSHPVFMAASADPVTTFVDIGDGSVESFLSSERGSSSLWERSPTGADGDWGSDGHLHVIAPDRRSAVEMWIARRQSSTQVNAMRVTRTNLYGYGIKEGGVRAYNGSALGGLIRIHEMNARSIPHAVALAMGDYQLGNPPQWPATTDDGYYNYPGPVRMGQMFAIPPTVNIDALGLNADARAVAKALQTYGGYVVDYGAPTVVYMQPGVTHTQANNVGAQMNIIKNQLRRVTNISEAGWNTWKANCEGMGGGTPRVPFAPKL